MPSAPKERQVEERLAKEAEAHDTPGAAIGIYHEGSEYYAFHGVTSIENPLEVDENTLFQYGSTNKTFTATAVMRLVEKGLVDLDERVRTYIPELKLKDEDVAREVRVVNLLNHTAGWEGDFESDTGNGDDALAKFVEKLAEAEQEFPLGKSFSYNNASLALAGRVIEKVTSQTYEEALKELILDPLGLEKTFVFANDVMTRRFVVGHTNRPDGTTEIARPWGGIRAESAAGANVSANAADQIKWARFHLSDGKAADGTQVLSAELTRKMREPTVETHGMLGDYVGISWILEDVEGVRIVGHGGNTNGQQSVFEMVPERDFAVAVLTNANPNGYQVHQEMLKWALEAYTGVVKRDPEPIEPTVTELSRYAGTFETVAAVVRIEVKDGGLTLKMESKDPEADSWPPFALGVLPGDRVMVIEGVAKGLTGLLVRDESGSIEGLHIGGRLATRVI